MNAILQDRIYELSIFGMHDAWGHCGFVRQVVKAMANGVSHRNESLWAMYHVLPQRLGRVHGPGQWRRSDLPVKGGSIWKGT